MVEHYFLNQKLMIFSWILREWRLSLTKLFFKIIAFRDIIFVFIINNYRYLQFLDLIENKEGVAIEVNNSSEIFRRQIDRYALNFETLLSYARFYKSLKVYDGLAKLAKGGG